MPAASDSELTGLRLDGCSHVIDDDSFFLGSVMIEACRPPFKGLEAEGEAELSGWESTAIVNHHLITSEHVPRLEVSHLEVPVSRCLNVLRTEVFVIVLLRLAA